MRLLSANHGGRLMRGDACRAPHDPVTGAAWCNARLRPEGRYWSSDDVAARPCAGSGSQEDLRCKTATQNVPGQD